MHRSRVRNSLLASLLVTVVAATAFIAGPAPQAQAAPTPVPITVVADAVGEDGQITTGGEFLYNSLRDDTPENGYQIAYRGTLSLSEVWSSYTLFRTLWLLQNGWDIARWNAKTFTGNFTIQFTVDPNVVQVNPAFVSCAALQAQYESDNSTTTFPSIMRCENVRYDDATGTFSADFRLVNADGTQVTGAQLDVATNRPASLQLLTPSHALYVPQSNFVAGSSFTMTSPRVTGQMAMDAFYVGMPLTFDHTGNSVTLTMADTYDATFAFVSGTAGRDLPADVLALVPGTQPMLRDGDVVTPTAPAQTSVVDGQGTWTFQGWAPASGTVAGADLHFVGTWTYAVNPDAEFPVDYAFESGTSGASLPSEVTSLLPAGSSAQQGSTVTPDTLSTTTVTTSAGTWTFQGWQPASAVIDGAAVTFVGTWTFVPVEVPPTETPTPSAQPTPSGTALPSTGGELSPWIGGGALLLVLAGLALTLARRTHRV